MITPEEFVRSVSTPLGQLDVLGADSDQGRAECGDIREDVVAVPRTDEVHVARAGAAAVRDDDADEPRRRQHGLRAGQAETIGRHHNPGARLPAHRDRRPCSCADPRERHKLCAQQTHLKSAARDDSECRLQIIHNIWRRHSDRWIRSAGSFLQTTRGTSREKRTELLLFPKVSRMRENRQYELLQIIGTRVK